MLEGMAKILRRPFSAQVVLALPEFSGLKRLGEGVSWTYDPTHPPEAKRLEALKARFAAEPGVTVRELPGGGWEAVDSEGVTRIQVLPAGPQIAGLLEAPLRDMVAGGRGQSAADLIDAQSAVPELGSVMKDLAPRLGQDVGAEDPGGDRPTRRRRARFGRRERVARPQQLPAPGRRPCAARPAAHVPGR